MLQKTIQERNKNKLWCSNLEYIQMGYTYKNIPSTQSCKYELKEVKGWKIKKNTNAETLTFQRLLKQLRPNHLFCRFNSNIKEDLLNFFFTNNV